MGLVLVGCPVHLSGRRGEMAEEASRFAQRIEKELKVRVELRDERLTSWEAEEIMKELGGSKRKKKQNDSTAAAILLREYLETRRSKQISSSAAGV